MVLSVVLDIQNSTIWLLLCSRQSFFGGSLSTARDSAAAGYIPPELRLKPEPELDPQRGKARLSAGGVRDPKTPASRARPSIRKAADYSDFASLSSETDVLVSMKELRSTSVQ